MIQPRLLKPIDKIQEFLHEHIQLDLQHIATCCDLSVDDCLLLVHDVIKRMKGLLFDF